MIKVEKNRIWWCPEYLKVSDLTAPEEAAFDLVLLEDGRTHVLVVHPSMLVTESDQDSVIASYSIGKVLPSWEGSSEMGSIEIGETVICEAPTTLGQLSDLSSNEFIVVELEDNCLELKMAD